MRRNFNALLLFLLVMLTACNANAASTSQTLPTLARLPTQPSTITVLPSAFPTWTPSATFTPSATVTITASPIRIDGLTPLPTETMTATAILPATATATALPDSFIFGQSAGGRDLIAYRYGTGRFVIMLVGGIHAGFEANTVDLVLELRDYLRANPTMIEPDITFLLVPSLNPDGLTRGRIIDGRFNGNGVDLNRNWGCGWSPDAVFGEEAVDAGSEPFSEPETIALGSLIQRINPAAVIFYHGAANGVFAGSCADGENISGELAALYGEASGYPYGAGDGFGDYIVTGSAPAWVDSLGIPALDIELASATATEFRRNLRALLAIQTWVQSNR